MALGNCKTCESKDSEIAFLREMVKNLSEPFKASTQIFTPSYANEKGDLIPMDKTDEEGTVETKIEIVGPDGQTILETHKMDIVGEIVGH